MGALVAKLERQLDDLYGERRVEIHWPSDEEVDVDLLRLHLISEIDSHTRRIPLDLRGVNGSPEELVDLLLEMQRYAMAQSKVLSISASLPPMQEALNPRRRRKAARAQEAIHEDGARNASEVARSAINSHGNSEPNAYLAYQAEVVAERRVRSRTKPRRKRKRYLTLLLLIFGSLLLLMVFHWFFNFETKPVIYDSEKTFENID